ncbi:hypothetical protein RRG08_014524 [Elysia crispata]|uniref:Uncharacterized protein n=1 Tax=Elysia crispata TaxID=231223 RepID=A0AAE1AX29_9GAST|nr:hypothetical protein RRG08_014524 [Elysia crispata]
MIPDHSPPLTEHAQHGHYKHRLFGQVVWTMGVKDGPRSFSTSHWTCPAWTLQAQVTWTSCVDNVTQRWF